MRLYWKSEASEFVLSTVITGIKAYASGLGAFFSNFDLLKIIKANFSLEGIKGGGGLGEAARQFGSASPAAESAFNDVISEEAARKVGEEIAAATARAEAEKNKNKPPGFEEKTKELKPIRTQINTDALLSVGNFLGAGKSSTIESIAQKSYAVQQKMEKHLDKIANKQSDIEVPP